jgi:hypothetical protein
MRIRNALFVFMGLTCVKSVSAYIDPGTGGMIIGGSLWPLIVAGLAAAGGFILGLFKPVRSWLSSLFGRSRGES